MAEFIAPPALTELAVSCTLRCSSVCRHCSVESSPERRETLDPQAVLPLVPALHDRGVRRLLFTGGEPILCLDELESIVKATKTLGWRIGLFSNGSWGASEGSAESGAATLQRCNVHRVYFSTSRFHREFVGVDSIYRAVAALARRGISSHVYCHLDRTRSIKDLLVAADLAARGVSASPFHLYPEGRARHLEGLGVLRVPVEQVLSERCALMNQVFVDTSGAVMRCCAVADRQGRIESREFFYYGRAGRDPAEEVLARMTAWGPMFGVLDRQGPGGVFMRLSSHLAGTSFALEDSYFSPCDLCVSLLGNPRVLDVVRSVFGISSR